MQNVTAPVVNGATPPGRVNPVQTATASLQNVERAIGDLRANNSGGGRGGGGRRGNHHHNNNAANEIEIPATDFDFQGSNARFDKSALSTTPAGTENGENEKDKEELKAYNPQRSFFDTLSSSQAQGGGGGRGGGGGGGRRGGGGGQGRNRREEERERNVATFGEPGGIGLMGPGAYVGGWGGGYNRRGGGRGRRGGANGAR
jgi:protein LSM14